MGAPEFISGLGWCLFQFYRLKGITTFYSELQFERWGAGLAVLVYLELGFPEVKN